MARRRSAAPLLVPSDDNPDKVTQQRLDSPRGKVRAWFRGGICYRVAVAQAIYGWGEGPAVWAAILDGSFRPQDYGKHNSR